MKTAYLQTIITCILLASCETTEPNGRPYNCDTAYNFCQGNAHDIVASQRCQEDYNRCKNR
jgi:hypothetical protein